jgi:hypothetical protein
VFHAQRTSSSHAQEADEGADRADNALGTIDPVRARPIEDEGAQNLGGIGPCVIAQSIQEPRKDSLIEYVLGAGAMKLVWREAQRLPSITWLINLLSVPGCKTLNSKGQYCAREQSLRWMPPVSRAGSEGVVQNLDPISRMKLSRWCQRAPKLPLTPLGFSLFIQRRCRGFWLEPVLGLSG